MTTRPKPSVREQILAVGAALFAEAGYHATGVDSVLRRARVPKGSFYHYFGSKEDFGIAVIDHCAHLADTALEALVADQSLSARQRLERYFAQGIEEAASHQCKRGCLIGMLSQELSAQADPIRRRLDEVFRKWEKTLAGWLREAVAAGECSLGGRSADEMAAFLWAGWEGALLRGKVARSTEPMRLFVDFTMKELLGTKQGANS